MTLDYLSHLREDSARFVAVLRDAPVDGPVPSCPDWQSDDLLWHLGEVQWFWGTIVRDAVTDPDGLQHPDRPADREGLLAFFDEASTGLQAALADTDPAEHRWTWSEDQTAGFIRRRQAHEALIHRVDAELTADVQHAPIAPELATDGVDEALRVMFAGCPPWGRVDPEPGATLRVRTTDTEHTWLVTLATFSGTAPTAGRTPRSRTSSSPTRTPAMTPPPRRGGRRGPRLLAVGAPDGGGAAAYRRGDGARPLPGDRGQGVD